jgi:hypothetical protein
MQVTIYFFAYNFKEVWNRTLDEPISEDIWYRNGFFTYIGPPILESFKMLEKTIAKKNTAHMYLFTDGECSYPGWYMNHVKEIVDQNRE